MYVSCAAIKTGIKIHPDVQLNRRRWPKPTANVEE